MFKNKKLNKYLFIAVAVILFSLPFLWFRGKLFLGGDDNKAYFYDIANYIRYIPWYSWVDSGAIGTFIPQQFAIFYLALIWVLNLVLPNYAVQHAFYGLTLALSFLFQYKFIETLLNSLVKRTNKTNIQVASALSALFYVVVPISFHLLWRQPNHMTYCLLFFPIVLYFFLKSINEGKLKYLIFLGFILPLLSMVILPIIPAVTAFIGGSVIFFFLYSYKMGKVKLFFKNSLIFLLIAIASLSFWLVPFVQGNLSASQETLVATNLVEETKVAKVKYAETLISEFTNVLYPLITQIDYLSYKIHDKSYYESIESLVIAEVTLFFLLCIVLSLLFLKKYNKNFKFVYLSLFLVTLGYLACSSIRINDYFVKFWVWCMNNIPLFTMWRSPPFFYIPYIMFYSFLLGLALFMVLEAVKRRFFKKAIIVLSLICLFVMGIPLFLGKPSTGPASLQTEYTSVVDVPEELGDMLEDIRHVSADYKMLNFPIANPEYLVFQDGKGGIFEGPSLVNQLTGKTHFSGLTSFRNAYTDFYATFIDIILFPGRTDYVKKVLSNLNLKYILLHKDEAFFNSIDYPYNFNNPQVHKGFRDFDNYHAVLENNNFTLLAENDGYALYEYAELTLPKIFTTEDYTLVSMKDLARVHNGKVYHNVFKNPFLGNDRNVLIYDNGVLFQDTVDKIESSIDYIPLIAKLTDKVVSPTLAEFNQYNFFVTKPGTYDLFAEIKSYPVFGKYDPERGWLFRLESAARDFVLENKQTGEKINIPADSKEKQYIIKEISKDEKLTLQLSGNPMHLDNVDFKDWKYIERYHTDLKDTMKIFTQAETQIEIPDFSDINVWQPHLCGTSGPAAEQPFETKAYRDTDGQDVFLLGTDKDNVACGFADVLNFVPKYIYKISFYYNNLEGNPAEFSVCSEARETCFTEKLRENNNQWNYYETIYTPESGDKAIRLFLYANAKKNKHTTTLFKNVDVGIYKYSPLKIETKEKFFLQKTAVTLDKGEYSIAYEPSEEDYVEEKPYFFSFSSGEEFSNWSKGSCYTPLGEPNFRFEQSDDFVDSEETFLISASNSHIACAFSDMQNFEPGKIYKISFSYKNVEGNPAEFSICSPKNGTCEAEDHNKENYGKWNHFETYYKPADPGELGIRMFLYANSKDDKLTTSLFSNIKVEKFDQAPDYSFLIQDKEPGEVVDSTVIEYKRISIEKYRLRIKNFSSSRLVTLLENYDPNWKAYIVKSGFEKNTDFPMMPRGDYLSGLGASEQEVVDYAKQGTITASGNNFISKLTYGTIQNDNLPSGFIWDTWFKKALPEEDHIFVNGYANSWFINLEDLEKNGKVTKNADGTYDFEMIITFWPQRMFWLGFLITLTFMALSGWYLVKIRNKKVRNKIQTN